MPETEEEPPTTACRETDTLENTSNGPITENPPATPDEPVTETDEPNCTSARADSELPEVVIPPMETVRLT